MNDVKLPIKKELSEKAKAQLIKRVIRNFDFQRVKKVMVALDWKWRGEKVTIQKMKEQAAVLLYNVLNNDNVCTSSSGGFSAFQEGNLLGLLFVIEGFEVEYEFNEEVEV